MIRSVPWLLGLLALAACQVAPPLAPARSDAACRWGPDGGPPLADRGIGGTGAPARQADRGIGGTGIVGIVTGFASVCVNGREVAYDPTVPVDIDGIAASADALRVGQTIALAAQPIDTGLHAIRISARHEVIGPVTDVSGREAGLVVVAGQRVRIASTAVGSGVVQPGAWVAVSGMRGPDGDVIASRIDPAPAGPVSVHGPLIASEGTAWIGDMQVHAKGGFDDSAGTYVFVSGSLGDGALEADVLAPDTLIANPPAYFGTGTRQIEIASYARVSGGTVHIGGAYAAAVAPNSALPSDFRGAVVVSLTAQPDGSFAVIGLRAAHGVAAAPSGFQGAQIGGERPVHTATPALAHPVVSTTAGSVPLQGGMATSAAGLGSAVPVKPAGMASGGAMGIAAAKAVKPPAIKPPH